VKLTTLFILLTFLSCCAGCHPKAQITISVVGDDGKSVEGAEVTVVGFTKIRTGHTDRQGKFTVTIPNPVSSVDLAVNKKAYYSINRHIYEFNGGLVNGRWEPWNPEVELYLHRKGKAVPMIQRRVEAFFPVTNESVGYDLVLGDWVQPHGQGKTNDFIFTAIRNLAGDSERSGTLELRFASPADGLLRETIHWRNDYALRLASQAPLTGYSNRWLFTYRSKTNPDSRQKDVQASFSEDDNYYFRVRSQINDRGEVTSALHGKIFWGIHYVLGSTDLNPLAGRTNPMPWVRFFYYINPDGTRNIESEEERQQANEL